jgi:hypothetical protein
MAGMGDPYGLVEDESDFLIHPSMLPDGQAVKFYGHYRYTYADINDWDVDWAWQGDWENFDGNGDEQTHEVLLGSTFSVGPGRMGAFFSYQGQRNDYDADCYRSTISDSDEYTFENEFDEFALRLMYGLPLNNVSVGAEAGVAYKQEESKNSRYDPFNVSKEYNEFYWMGYYYNIFPYDSDYWEALLKGSIQHTFGPVDAAFTLRGGYILTGENEYDYSYEDPFGSTIFDLDGDIYGYSIGGDLWLRYALCEGVTLPFLVRVDYNEKTRKGNGYDSDGFFNDYEHHEKNLNVEAGGGFDRKCSETGSRLAGGIYYNYIKNKNDFNHHYGSPLVPDFEETDWNGPDITEHRAILKLLWEKQLSPIVTLRTGTNGFYGRMKLKTSYPYSDLFGADEERWTSTGYHWGLNAYIGSTIMLNSVSLEPFINGGYQQYDLDGDGEYFSNGSWVFDYDTVDYSQDKWFVGGGFSVLFGN